MRKLAIVALVLLGGLIAAALVWQVVRPGALTGTSKVVDATDQLISRGEYLARVGDCIACHTPPGGKPFRHMTRKKLSTTDNSRARV